MKFVVLLRLVDVLNFILIYVVHAVFEGENTTYMILLKKKIGLYSEIYGRISFERDRMVKTTMLYILISVWMTMTFIQGHSCVKSQTCQCPFSGKFEYDELQYIATTCCFVEAHARIVLHKY